jgi:hypothetical protein
MKPVNSPPPSIQASVVALARAGSDLMALPFDLTRDNYVRAVRAGLIERSMLQSARFTRSLRMLEGFTLGIWARRI